MVSELDFKSLEQEFDLVPVENKNVDEIRDREIALDNQGDADNIIRLNIERANFFLDLAEQEFQNGAVNARTLEACSRLISEVTNAANSLKNIEIQKQTLDLKERTLDLKDFEIKNKLSKDNSGGSLTNITNNNVVVTDRESLLKMLSDNEDEEIIDV